MNSLQRSPVQPYRLDVRLACNDADVLAAQRLRYQVFSEELGAKLDCADTGFDQDMFDPYCEHMIVCDETSGEVVGTYRMLTPEGARRAGGFYSETEFDIVRLRNILPAVVEVGRSCVRADFRTGAVIALLWSAIISFVRARGGAFVMGCTSVGLEDGGRNAAGIYTQIATKHLSPEDWRVSPFHPLPLHDPDPGFAVRIPPLLKGYIRVGAYICGEPAWDPAFCTADFFTLLSLNRMNPRFRRHLIGS